MKWLISITITLVFSFTLIFSANAAESDITSMQPSMPGPWHPGRYYLTYQDVEGKQVQQSMPGLGHHHMPHPPWDDWSDSGHGHHSGNFKIADLLDNEGPEIVLLKDETLIIMDNQGNVLIEKGVEDIEDRHGGWWFMPGHDHNGGGVGLEVADLDDDGTLEIIILDTEKLIVLDNKGDPKSPIPLPEVDAE